MEKIELNIYGIEKSKISNIKFNYQIYLRKLKTILICLVNKIFTSSFNNFQSYEDYSHYLINYLSEKKIYKIKIQY